MKTLTINTFVKFGSRSIAIFPIAILIGCAGFDPTKSTNYSNIEPVDPMPVGLANHFTYGEVSSLNPILKWKPKENVQSYDVAVWKSAGMSHAGVTDALNLGERVFYASGLKANSVQVNPALVPNKVYYWSVRPTGEANWSTFDQKGLIDSQNNYFWFSTL